MNHLMFEDPSLLPISMAATLIARGELTSQALVEACLDRIHGRDSTVHAWAHLDADAAIAEARRLDRIAPSGPLHGIPVGIKDIIDTADMPTTYGSAIYAGHRPHSNAICVQQLRAAGAIVLGKTVSTEFAFYHPGPTRNPYAPSHTPGGSSSGSAAAVADRQVGLSLGTQTSGSIIRPASFNGVIGYKPSFGTFDYSGVRPLAPSLDTLGLFTRDFADLELASQVLRRTSSATIREELPARALRIGLCRTGRWQSVDPAMREAWLQTVERLEKLGAEVVEVVLPSQFDGLHAVHQTIMSSEAYHCFRPVLDGHAASLSKEFTLLLNEGARYAPVDLANAWREVDACREYFGMVMRDFDVLLTPAAIGEAPAGLEHTGSPVFNRIWTLLGVPCVTYPVSLGPDRLPLGVQVVGHKGGDANLLACAGWMHARTGIVPELPRGKK